MKNWGRNLTFEPKAKIEALSTEHVQNIVKQAGRENQRVKAMGSGHSFSPISLGPDLLLTMNKMNRILDFDPETNQVRVEAGITIAQLNRELLRRGLALPNLGDIDAQTISGAISTSTHGTGGKKFGLAHTVVAIQLVTASGEVVEIDHTNPAYQAARVSLGALGIITQYTLQAVPAFALHAEERPEHVAEVESSLDSLIESNDHFEFYWWPHTEYTTVKLNNTTTQPLKPLSKIRFAFEDEFASNGLFELMALSGTMRRSWVPKINRIAGKTLSAREYTDHSFNVFTSPRRVRFREMEYAMDRSVAHEVLSELREVVNSHDETVGFPVEVRFTAADDIWMSTSTNRDSIYIAVHMYHRQDFERYFARVEQLFQSFQGRPHWGKLNTADSTYLRSVYPRFDDFLSVREQLDPNRMFNNEYLDRVLGL